MENKKAVIAERIKQMTPSATSSLIGKIAGMKAAGIDIIGFNAGEPDFATPGAITEACEKALRDGKTTYVSVAGILPLRQTVADKLLADNGVRYSPDQIIISTGAKQALFNAVMALCDPGDEVIIPVPCWVSYVEMIKLAQAVPVPVKTKPDYTLDLDAIREAISAKTRAIIINTPNNPTGAVYPPEDLASLGELAVSRDFYIISDEVYEKLLYDGARHLSVAGVSQDIHAKTITINGFSKTYCMTGWRLGYAAAPEGICKAMTALQGHTTSNSSTFVQWAGITALTECSDEVVSMRGEFERRRNRMLDMLLKIPGITCKRPGGAFYLMPNVSYYFGKSYAGRYIDNAVDLCGYALDEAKVAIVPGEAFEMPGTARFSYSTSMDNINEGMRRFETALNKLK